MLEAIFGECLNYKSGLRILIGALEVPFFVVQKQALLPKVPIFETQKMALLVATSKFSDHFYSSNIPQILSLGLLFHEIITFKPDFGQISILLIFFGPILGIFPL